MEARLGSEAPLDGAAQNARRASLELGKAHPWHAAARPLRCIIAHVVWQAWTNSDPYQNCPYVTPARNRTWGSIKAIYR